MARFPLTSALLLSLQASLFTVSSAQPDIFIGGGDLGFDFPNDDTFNAIGNCCEGGCDQACNWLDEQFFGGLARHRKMQINFDPSRLNFDPSFPLPPVGPNADLDMVNAHCCCRDGGCFGDPHFKLWNNEEYDFHGQCSLVLLDAPEAFDNLGVTVHVRTKVRNSYSFIESAAIKIGDDVFEVSSWGEHSLNGVDGASMPNHLGPFPVTQTEVFRSKKDTRFEIDLGHGQQIVVKTFKDWVSVQMVKMTQREFKNSSGLMGDFKTGAMLARDGKTVLSNPNEFGQEWQVRSGEPQLFQTVLGPQHPERCMMPDMASDVGRRRLGEARVSREEANAACEHLEGLSKGNCVNDVLQSGEVDMAQAYDH